MKRQASLLLVILLLLLPMAPAMAQTASDTTIPASVFSHSDLDVSIDRTYFNFSDSHAHRILSIAVKNPEDSRMDVYVALYQHQQWNVVSKLGSVDAGTSKTFSYPVDFNYTGKTTEVDRFGIAGKTARGYLGSAFTITENWTTYEDALKSSLSFFGILSACVLLGVLIIILAGVLSMANRMKYNGEAGEYTLRTLFFPITKMRPWAERIADIIINPFFWLIELGLGTVLIVLILWFSLHDIRQDIGILVFAVGGVAAIFMPVVFLVIRMAGRLL